MKVIGFNENNLTVIHWNDVPENERTMKTMYIIQVQWVSS